MTYLPRNRPRGTSQLAAFCKTSIRDLAAVVRAHAHFPVLLDVGEFLDNGGIQYVYWIDQPDITKDGSFRKDRKLDVSYSSGNVYEIFLSTFQLDDEGQPTSIDSITCTSDKKLTPECLISETPRGIQVSVKLATPSYATLQVTIHSRENGLPAQQSTWLL